jgi:hypothetical protein
LGSLRHYTTWSESTTISATALAVRRPSSGRPTRSLIVRTAAVYGRKAARKSRLCPRRAATANNMSVSARATWFLSAENVIKCLRRARRRMVEGVLHGCHSSVRKRSPPRVGRHEAGVFHRRWPDEHSEKSKRECNQTGLAPFKPGAVEGLCTEAFTRAVPASQRIPRRGFSFHLNSCCLLPPHE